MDVDRSKRVDLVIIMLYSCYIINIFHNAYLIKVKIVLDKGITIYFNGDNTNTNKAGTLEGFSYL